MNNSILNYVERLSTHDLPVLSNKQSCIRIQEFRPKMNMSQQIACLQNELTQESIESKHNRSPISKVLLYRKLFKNERIHYQRSKPQHRKQLDDLLISNRLQWQEPPPKLPKIKLNISELNLAESPTRKISPNKPTSTLHLISQDRKNPAPVQRRTSLMKHLDILDDFDGYNPRPFRDASYIERTMLDRNQHIKNSIENWLSH